MKASWSNDPETQKRQVAKSYHELKSDVWTVRMGRLAQYKHVQKTVVSLPVLFVSLDSLHDLFALVEEIDTAVIIEKTKLVKAGQLQSGEWTLLVYDGYLPAE